MAEPSAGRHTDCRATLVATADAVHDVRQAVTIDVTDDRAAFRTARQSHREARQELARGAADIVGVEHDDPADQTGVVRGVDDLQHAVAVHVAQRGTGDPVVSGVRRR